MRSATKQKLAGMACGVATLASSNAAWAVDQYLELEPPKGGQGVGYGYDSISRTPTNFQCIDMASVQYDDAGDPESDTHFSRVVNFSQVSEDMDLTVSAKVNVSFGIASFATNDRVDLSSKTSTNTTSLKILASWFQIDGFKHMTGDINLKPEYLALVGTPAFRAKCGDYFFSSAKQGKWFFGTASTTATDTTTESKLAVKSVTSASYATASAQADASTLRNLKSVVGASSIDLRASTSGGLKHFSDVEEFIAAYSDPNTGGGRTTFKLMAIPYEKAIHNWPSSANPLAPRTYEDMVKELANLAGGLMSLIDDYDFAINHSELFALGTGDARGARHSWLKVRRAYAKLALDDLRQKGQNCYSNWDGTPSCKEIYSKWQNYFGDFLIKEYADFPVRYESDCATPHDFSKAAQSALNTGNGPGLQNQSNGIAGSKGKFIQTNANADTIIGGSPVNFESSFRMYPDVQAGADVSSARNLFGDLRMWIKEDAADRTVFFYRLPIQIFNLDAADPSQGDQPVTWRQCQFKGNGVKMTPLSGGNVYGMINGHANGPATNVTFAQSIQGMTSSITCTVDNSRHGGDASVDIGCSNLSLRDVKLDLVNSEDVKADSWTQPAYNGPSLLNFSFNTNPPKVALRMGPNGAALVAVTPAARAAAAARTSTAEARMANLKNYLGVRGISGRGLSAGACNGKLVKIKGRCLPRFVR